MATKRQRASGTWEFIFKNKSLLPKAISVTFDSYDAGVAFENKAEALMAQGIIPQEFYTKTMADGKYKTLADVIRGYIFEAHHVSGADISYLNSIVGDLGDRKVSTLTDQWAIEWLGKMKERGLAPATIRHKVGALRRCLDWGASQKITALGVNPLRTLPKKYSYYSKRDIEAGGIERLDVSRDRRLSSDGEEEKKIREAIANYTGEANIASIALIFDLALESAMRMREIYTLEVSQVNLTNNTIFLDKTKNGDKRQVPMTTVSKRLIQQYMKEGNPKHGFMFPCWNNGDYSKDNLDKITAKVSRIFANIFYEAGCGDLHFHDLRHEATSRIYERTTLTDLQISKITGHKTLQMLQRYANLRGSDLSSKLW